MFIQAKDKHSSRSDDVALLHPVHFIFKVDCSFVMFQQQCLILHHNLVETCGCLLHQILIQPNVFGSAVSHQIKMFELATESC